MSNVFVGLTFDVKDDPAWVRETLAWLDAPDTLDDHAVRGQLARLVPEYRPAESR